MEIQVKLDEGAYMPEKAHSSDAGFDLRTPIEFILRKTWHKTIDTGVHMIIPDGYCGLLVSKSGLNVRDSITGTGLIDAGYTGSIQVKLYNDSESIKEFSAGDKIIQIIILPVPEIELIQIDEITETTERGNNGFGSSGK